MNWIPFSLCLLAAFLYAAEIALTERALKEISPIAITMFFGLGITFWAAPFVLKGVFYPNEDEEPIRMPIGREWLLLFVIATLTFFADWSHFGALKVKVGATALATFYILIPVFCTMMKGELPTKKTVLAWALASAAIFLLKDEVSD